MPVPYRFAAALARADDDLRSARLAVVSARSDATAARAALGTLREANASVRAGPWGAAWSLRDFEPWCRRERSGELAAVDVRARAERVLDDRLRAYEAARSVAERLERHRARGRIAERRERQRRDTAERDEANRAATVRRESDG